MSGIYIEKSRERGNDFIKVSFAYDQLLVEKIKQIPGRRFTGKDQGGPYWRVPLDIESCHKLRAAFGDTLVIGPELKTWAWREVHRHQELPRLAGAKDAELIRLPQVLPELAQTLRGYQRAGAAFIAAGNPLVADQPGLGKTLEVIAGIYEAGIEDGPHLVVAPLTATDTVWEHELTRWQHLPVYMASSGSMPQRQQIVDCFSEEVVDSDLGGWLVVNPDMIRMKSTFDPCDYHLGMKLSTKEQRRCSLCTERLSSKYPILHNINWATVTIDECHKGAIRNPQTMTAKAINSLNVREDGKRIATSGTPMTNRAIDLWGSLHFLNPASFTSKWRWAGEWCNIESNGFGKVIGGIKEAKRDEFNKHIAPYVLRRTKDEVLAELPPKSYVDLWLDMTMDQAKQYNAMAKDAEIRMAETELTALNVLDEYTRLKQFANSQCTIASEGDGKVSVTPTENSNKLTAILQLLEERGITAKESEGEEKVVIFSQFSKMVRMIADALEQRGIAVARLTGDTTRKGERKSIQQTFQGAGGPRVLVMTTTAGGTAITLDRADTVIFTDETWSPSDQEQAEDRVHRVSRIHNVTIYYLRSKQTIEQYIMEQGIDKETIHKTILDVRRGRSLMLRG